MDDRIVVASGDTLFRKIKRLFCLHKYIPEYHPYLGDKRPLLMCKKCGYYKGNSYGKSK